MLGQFLTEDRQLSRLHNQGIREETQRCSIRSVLPAERLLESLRGRKFDARPHAQGAEVRAGTPRRAARAGNVARRARRARIEPIDINVCACRTVRLPWRCPNEQAYGNSGCYPSHVRRHTILDGQRLSSHPLPLNSPRRGRISLIEGATPIRARVSTWPPPRRGGRPAGNVCLAMKAAPLPSASRYTEKLS